MERALKFVQQLERCRYRAAVDRSEFNDKLKISKDENFFSADPLPWLTDEDVDNGMKAAFSDANADKDGSVYFCGQLLFSTDGNANLTAPKKQNDLRFSKIQAHHSKFVWFVNLTPVDRRPGAMNRPGRGSHWVVILAELPVRIGYLQTHEPNITLRVKYFDPMGGDLPESIKGEFERLINDQLVGNLMRLNKELAVSPLYNNIKLSYEYKNLSLRIQRNDTVQCGVFCIWFFHQFLVNNMNLSDLMTWKRPENQSEPANRAAFRMWYFKRYPNQPTTTATSSKKRKMVLNTSSSKSSKSNQGTSRGDSIQLDSDSDSD